MELCQRKGYVLVGILKVRVGGQTHISDFVIDVYYRLPLNQLDKVSHFQALLFTADHSHKYLLKGKHKGKKKRSRTFLVYIDEKFLTHMIKLLVRKAALLVLTPKERKNCLRTQRPGQLWLQ